VLYRKKTDERIPSAAIPSLLDDRRELKTPARYPKVLRTFVEQGVFLFRIDGIGDPVFCHFLQLLFNGA
jgi:hypothetical protein